MKLFMRVLVAVVTLSGSAAVLAFGVERFVENVHYSRVPNGAAKPGTVVEFFSFGCPHCAHLEPAVEKWLEKKPESATFARVPATWNPNFQHLARLYYTLEKLGLADKNMQKVFDHLHKDKKSLSTEQDVMAFLTGMGVAKDQAETAWNAPDVSDKLREAHQKLGQYRITGVPAFVVNGQYSTSVNMAGSEQELFEVINFLLMK